ncbi:MAG: response regulator [Deferrisomatales bacterium]|nr:response regulator [Deferrisomatales bacterium]
MAHVLVIDDHALIRELLELELASAGHVVTAVPDGPSGLAVALHHPPDLVVLDFRLRGIDGLAVLRAFRALNPALPVFFYTVLGDFPDRTDFAEADACFVKSGDLTLLSKAIASVCSLQASHLADAVAGGEPASVAPIRSGDLGPEEPTA